MPAFVDRYGESSYSRDPVQSCSAKGLCRKPSIRCSLLSLAADRCHIREAGAACCPKESDAVKICSSAIVKFTFMSSFLFPAG